MFCSAVPQGTHKNPKIVCGLRTHPWSVQSLERHGSSGMPGAVRIRNAGFCDQNRCLQVPPGTCCHFTINSCPCFSPPHPPGCAGVFMHTGYSTPPAPGTASVPRSVSVWNTCSPADTVHSSACTDPRLFRSPHPQTESHNVNS